MQEIESEEIDDIVKNNKIVILDCYATWCQPCKTQAAMLEELEKRYKEVKFVKIDVDKDPEFSGIWEIYAVPTTIVFINEQIVVFGEDENSPDRIEGAVPINVFETLINHLLKDE